MLPARVPNIQREALPRTGGKGILPSTSRSGLFTGHDPYSGDATPAPPIPSVMRFATAPKGEVTISPFAS